MTLRSLLDTLALVAFCAAIVLGTASCSNPTSAEPIVGCLDTNGDPLPVAPDSERVDLSTPTFSNPTDISNPLFPVSTLHSVVFLGLSDGEPFRTEVTLLGGTRSIVVNGTAVPTLISQYVAFVNGRIHEVAIDWYGQDDAGAVWYFGEGVSNYEDGVVADVHGTWLAGKDGPVAMIMPGNPQVGDVYRPENMCGFVFEEVTVESTTVTVDGPTGLITGSMLVEELHMDATTEGKVFAPGYGEFSTGSGNNVEAMALAVPHDALTGPVPVELENLSSGALQVFTAADSADWGAASTALGDMNSAWIAYELGPVPPKLRTQMNGALNALANAIAAQSQGGSRQASIDVARATYDFRLRHQIPTEIDLARFTLWARQVLVDVKANDADAVKGDASILEWTRDRFIQSLNGATADQINGKLTLLRSAADAPDLPVAATTAQQLRDITEPLL